MKHAAAFLSLALLATPVAPVMAQEVEDGPSLMEEGARLFMRGLMAEMEPTLDELQGAMREMQPLMQDFMAEMGPALGTILEKVDDWAVYHPPEMLPNGDIIIRRKEPLPPDDSPLHNDPPKGAEIEL